MKTYIKPSTELIHVKIQGLMIPNSVNKVNGLDGVNVSKDNFEGGATDSRRRGSMWEDEE